MPEPFRGGNDLCFAPALRVWLFSLFLQRFISQRHLVLP
jgi:hypothetical protein